jgi:hypothetical protein
VVDKLTAMRGPGERYSDVILRLVEMEAMRPVNEVRFEARWKVGRLLAKVERQERKRFR